MRHVGLMIFVLVFIIAPWSPGSAVEQGGVIPQSLLSGSNGRELREVLEKASYTDEKRGLVIKGYREVYEYLLNHLDFASQLGRALNLTDYVIEETAAGAYEATTPKGAWAHLHVVYADDDTRVVLAEAKHGRAVVVLQYATFDRGGDSYIAYDLYGYVRADNPILRVLLGLLGGIVVNRRIEHVLDSVAELNERIYSAPGLFYQELLARHELSPDHRSELLRILTQL